MTCSYWDGTSPTSHRVCEAKRLGVSATKRWCGCPGLGAGRPARGGPFFRWGEALWTCLAEPHGGQCCGGHTALAPREEPWAPGQSSECQRAERGLCDTGASPVCGSVCSLCALYTHTDHRPPLRAKQHGRTRVRASAVAGCSSCREQVVSPYESRVREASPGWSRSQSEVRDPFPLGNNLLAMRCQQKHL